MPALQFRKRIEATPEAVFAAIADFANYHRWLARSSSFGTIRDISPDPVALGTTYVDAGPSGKRYGTVTEFEPPTRIAFEQPMEIPKGLVTGKLEIRVRYQLRADGNATDLTRDLSYAISGRLRLASPLIVSAIRRENERLLEALKRHLETGA
jgi:uncharacterized protein YndB with AHSA1/START domain